MQNVICSFRGCGYCSDNGFCLNRLVVINEQGVCKYLTKPGWEQRVQDWQKSTYKEPEKQGQEQNQKLLQSAATGSSDLLDQFKSVSK